MTAAIIGGGIAGLTSAYELVKAGERPILIEPGPLGGMLRSIHCKGFTLEAGPNVLVERPDMAALLGDLGLYDDVRYPEVNPYGQYVWFRGRAEKVPAGLIELLGSPLLRVSTKITLPFKLIMPGALNGTTPDRSVAQFFSPLIGTHTVRCLLDPVLKGIYGGEVDELSARSLFPGLWEAARKRQSIVHYMRNRPSKGKPRIMVIRGGIQRLTQTLWDRISQYVEHLPLRVERISPLDKKRFRIALSDGRYLEVDGCVVTTAGHATVPLVSHLSEDLVSSLERMRFAGLTVVHCAVPRAEALIPDAFGVLFPGGMPQHLLGVMFNSQIFPHVAPPGYHVLTVVLGGAQAGETDLDEATVRAELPTILSQFLDVRQVEVLNISHWKKAIPQLTVGHHEVVGKMDACEREFPGIVFVGVDRGGVGVSDRIRIAREGVKRFRRVRVETVV